MKHLQQVAVVLVLLMVAGCATPETAVKQRQAVVTEEGLPLKAGFVHTEKVHASGGPFSTEALYWDHFFPQAAPAFAESRRYDSMDAALSSDVDVVVEGKSLVYGSPERFKYALSVRVMTPRKNTVGRAKVHQRPIARADAEAAFASMGQLVRRDLLASEQLSQFVRTGEAGTR